MSKVENSLLIQQKPVYRTLWQFSVPETLIIAIMQVTKDAYLLLARDLVKRIIVILLYLIFKCVLDSISLAEMDIINISMFYLSSRH